MIGALDLMQAPAHARDGRRRSLARAVHLSSLGSLVLIVVVGAHLASSVAGLRGPVPWGGASSDDHSVSRDGTAHRSAELDPARPSAVLTHAALLTHVRRATSGPGTTLRELIVTVDPSTGGRTVLLRIDLEGTGPEAVSAALTALEHPALGGLAVTTIAPTPTGGRIELAARIAINPSRAGVSDARSDVPLATELTGLVTSAGARLAALELAVVRRDGAVLLVAEGDHRALVRLLEALESGPTAAPRVRSLRVAWEAQDAELRLTFTTREGSEDA